MVNAKFYIGYLFLTLRDLVGIPYNPKKEINKINLKKGQIILDYGCGIGSYTIPAAEIVGEKGKVYALDKESLALREVKKKAKKQGIKNIETILSDREISLCDESVDVVLLYGVLPEIKDKDFLLREIYRVLKPTGYLSTCYCFRMKKKDVLKIVEATNLYYLAEQKGRILNFKKIRK